MGLACSWQNLSVGILNSKVPMRLNKLFGVKLKLIQSSLTCLRVGTATVADFHAALFCHEKHKLCQNGENCSQMEMLYSPIFPAQGVLSREL